MKLEKRSSQLRWMMICAFVCCFMLFFLPQQAAAGAKVKVKAKACCAACCAASCADVDVIPMLQAPAVPKGDTYRFIAFGDTRTTDKSNTSEESKEFHHFRDLVLESVGRELSGGGIPFALFSGDLIWQGGIKYYWDEVYKIWNDKVRKKIYPVIGNHEAWSGDIGIPKPLTYYFQAFPQIKELHNHAFKIGNSLFINLCSGVYGEAYSRDNAIKWDREWNCRKWTFQQVNQALKMMLNSHLYGNSPVQNIFLTYHKPSYSFYGHPPLDDTNDPLQLMLLFKKFYSNLKNVFVFNGHNHTTEMYHPAAGVWVIVAGGGGAPQDPIKMNSYYKKEPELFWKTLGDKPLVPRELRINYFIVTVNNKTGDVQVREKYLKEDTGSKLVFVDGVSITNDELKIHK
jgi:hypothetical protein